MKHKKILVAILLATAWGRADQVTLKNGDRVTGSIVKKDATSLTIQSAHFGTITMPWDQVDSMLSDGPLYVSVGGGEAVGGTLSVSAGRAEFGGRSVDVMEITVIRNAAEQAAHERLLAPAWSELWTGSANMGWAGTAGNAQTQTFTVGANSARVSNSDKAAVYFNAIKASALVDGEKSGTAQAVRGGVSYNRNVSPHLFVTVFNDYEYDRFQSLDLRFGLGGGLGFKLVRSDRASLDLLGGLAYSREKFSIPLTRNSAEGYWGNDYSLKLNSSTTLNQTFRMFNNLSETGEYRMNGDLGISSKLSSRLTWNLGLSDRYLSNPAPGRKTNDLLYTTGFGLTFGQ